MAPSPLFGDNEDIENRIPLPPHRPARSATPPEYPCGPGCGRLLSVTDDNPDVVHARIECLIHALRIPATVHGLFQLGEVMIGYMKEHGITFNAWRKDAQGKRIIRLDPQHPIRFLRIEGPLAAALRKAPLSPPLDPKYLLKEEGEETNSGAHYSPRTIFGIIAWHAVARQELLRARQLGQPVRLLLLSSEFDPLMGPPPLPLGMLPSAYKALAARLERKDFSNLLELTEWINEAKVPLDDEREALWTSTESYHELLDLVPDGFGSRWANALTGRTSGGGRGMLDRAVRTASSSLFWMPLSE